MISVNIWDDFPDDGFVPEGEIQSTDLYLENLSDDVSDDYKKNVIQVIFDYILTLDTDFETINEGDAIKFNNITHKSLEKLLEQLENSDLKYANEEIEFYSES